MTSIKAIYIYPIKSCAPTELKACQLTPHGLKGDREFMIVDESGKFVTQRQFPEMALIQSRLKKESIILESNGSSPITFNTNDGNHKAIEVSVWKSKLLASLVNPKVDEWLSDYLGHKVCLVKYGPESKRSKRPEGHGTFPLMFTDGYPIHIINESSILDLGHRMQTSIDPGRFRPNIIIHDMEAYHEENLTSLTGLEVKMQLVKPTVRCVMPNVNQITGKEDLEVLSALSEYKKRNRKIEFGMNAYATQPGQISIGEKLVAQ